MGRGSHGHRQLAPADAGSGCPLDLLADPAAAAALAAAARRTAGAYAWPDLARTVLQVYKRVTGPGHDS